jgi:hypothetical protein
MRDHPYEEEKMEGNVFIRTFSEDTLEEELKWHWDEEDRNISLAYNGQVQETDWMFQMDNELPKRIEEQIFIPAGKWHRIIKGKGSLSLRVEKFPIENSQ